MHDFIFDNVFDGARAFLHGSTLVEEMGGFIKVIFGPLSEWEVTSSIL